MDKHVEIQQRGSKLPEKTAVTDRNAVVSVQPQSVIKVVAPPNSVSSMLREGDDLIIHFADGSTIRLDGYFACPTEDISQLFVADPASAGEWLVSFTDAACGLATDATSQALSYAYTPMASGIGAAAAAGGGISDGLLAGLGALVLGGGIAAAAGGGGSNRGPAGPVDQTPPAAPAISPSNGRSLSGTAEAGATVRIDLDANGSIDASVTADANGNWTYTPPNPIANGTRISVTAVDSAGNVSTPSQITVDAAAPAAPTIDPTDGTMLNGSAEAGSTVNIDLNGDGAPDASVVAGTDGRWAYTPAAPLVDGTTVTVTATDAVGNVSPPTSLTLDLSAPAAPVLVTLTDDVGAIIGGIASGGATDDRQPTLGGTAEAGAKLSIYDGNVLLGETTADANGAWSFTPAAPLAEGAHIISVTATDAAGNISAASPPFAFAVDTIAPAAPVLGPTDGTTISGTAEIGATIELDTDGDGIADATTTADANGEWRIILPTSLANGTQVSATATDAAGNRSGPGSAIVDTGLDTTPPAIPILGSVTDDVDPAQGPLSNGGATNDVRPLLAGGGVEAGATISIYDGGTVIGTTTADGAGNWTFTPTDALGEGAHSLTVTATDAFGNESDASPAFVLTVDTVAPDTPTIRPSNGAGLSGMAEPGATINLDLNGDGTVDVTVTADGTGEWQYVPDARLPDGATVIVTASDPAGNLSPPASRVVDADVPVAPVITGIVDDVAPIIGGLANGASSNDVQPTFSGTAEAGSTVYLYDNGAQIGTAAADGSGNWTFTPAALTDGAHSFSVTATDEAGNISGPSSPFVITVDTAAPAAPAMNPTDGNTISGTAEAGATIAIDINGDGAADATTTANSAGEWSVGLGTPLGNGTLVSATASDSAGNSSGPSTVTVTTAIDSTPPPIPTFDSATDDVAPVLSALSSGATSNDTQPLLAGSGVEAGATVSIYDNGVLLGNGTVDGSGNWTFTPGAPLSEGAHSLTVTATDGSGNESAASAPFLLTIDTAAPGAPTISPSNGDVLTGTAEAGATINIDLDGNGSADTSVTADPSGNWTFDPIGVVPDGTTVIVTASDAAGNVSGPASTVIDAIAPAAPAITALTDDQGGSTGGISPGAATDDDRPAIAGTADIGATVLLFDNGTQIGTAAVDGSGNWAFTPAIALPDGPHSFSARAVDAAGNVSSLSASFAITIDTLSPNAGAITGISDNVPGAIGPIPNGSLTNDAQPTLSGTADPGESVTIMDNGVAIGTAPVDGLGAWSFTPLAPLSDGAHSFTIVTVDAAGNGSSASTAYAVTIDSAAPAAPVIDAAADNSGSITGTVAAGGSTDEVQPTLSGTVEPGSTVAIFSNGTPAGNASVDPAGNWTFTPALPLGDGTYNFTAVATDPAGNSSGLSSPFTITIDTAAPSLPIITQASDDVGGAPTPIAPGGLTDDALPVLSGTTEALATVTIFDNGTAIGTTTADGSGNWTFTPGSPLALGAHSITASAIDAVGNESLQGAPFNFTLIAVAGGIPVIGGVSDDVGAVNGPVLNGGVTDDATPTLSGTGPASTTLAIFDNGTQIGTASTDGSGAWSFTPTTALTDGTHDLTAAEALGGGAFGPASGAFTINVDTAAPAAPAITVAIDDVAAFTGGITDGGLTNDSAPEIRGTGEIGATVTLFDNGSPVGTAVVDASGNWSISPVGPLAEGLHSFTASAADEAGNAGPLSAAFTLTVDLTPPPAPTITAVTDDVAQQTGTVTNGGISNDVLPQISGTAIAGSTVQIFDNGALLGTTVADGGGNWSFTPGGALANGSHGFTVAQLDSAGNASSPSPVYSVTIDTVAPTAGIAITTLTQDTGVVGDWSTQDSAPTIAGTLTAPLSAGERVEIQIDGGAWVSATASGTSWFYGPGTLAVGQHGVNVRVIDSAGNIGDVEAQQFTITNVNQAPIVQASGTSLLGLVGAEALGLIDLSTQSLTAYDPNNNLRSVEVRFAPLLSANLGAFTLTASTALAAELGLQVSIANNPGLLGILAPSSVLTVTALDGGPISNQAINELLNTVHFNQDLTLLGLNVLDTTTITATDMNGLTASSATGTLANLSLLNASGSSAVLEGNASANTINGTAANERLYGHGGADTLNGNGGNDLLRGGAGADTLNGGTGNDVLVHDAADASIDGGTGVDTLLIDSGTGMVLNLDAVNNIRNIERIDLGVGDAGRQITLTEAGIIRATEASHQLIVTGDLNDSVTMTGATLQGQTLINGQAFDHYALGTTNIYVEDPVMVVV
ncbi:hypothetical protein Sj15T_33330 [Sphingobium sp. TA15]|uniref:Large repetitive protein n=1 Tax=Sphingobium indicum (strain DSM 16413 / CCM 7287 / MTCC 6362 / UT26 / NBRC 101211 / UT26S) TaxID=452662 RepID=D4YYV4_SPHIU|nr:Ig-like domain-containing protein [Sphingobium indicum]BAI95536.1 large repetitive protein [Sphingobium indicum UT26S]BDD68312.1 hypothetical protein Sj15T_33330 [Sphingobium sp. TA15]